MKFSDFMTEIHACDVSLPTHMTPNNFTTAKEEFLANPELVMPNFAYDAYDFTDKITRLRELDSQLATTSTELQSAQAQIASEYLTEVRAKLTNLLTMQRYRELRNIKTSKESLAALNESIRKANLQLNDSPQPEIYRHLLENPTTKNIGFTPKAETVHKFRELFEKKWAKSFARIDMARDEYTPQEVCDLVNTIIQEDFEFETDFRAQIDKKKTGMNVDQINHVLDIPLNRSNGKFTPKVVRKVVLGHETFGHLYRAAFMQAKHPEIGIPLPGYGTFEEGVTKCIEQALSSNYELSGPKSYVICGLAACDKLTFREAFNRYCEYICIRKPRLELSEKTLGVIFTRTMRAFRGTGDIPLITITSPYFIKIKIAKTKCYIYCIIHNRYRARV